MVESGTGQHANHFLEQSVIGHWASLAEFPTVGFVETKLEPISTTTTKARSRELLASSTL